MGYYIHKYLSACVILAVGFVLIAQNVSAQELPDLVISTDSRIPLKGSCKKDEPLWKGRIAIKNIGDADAVFRGGGGLAEGGILAASQAKNVILSVYVPQNIDIKDTKALNRALRPLDQRGYSISIGEGRFKKCRLFGKPPTIRTEAGRYLSTYGYGPAQRRTSGSGSISVLQRALIAKGYPLPKFGPDGDYGGETEAALRDFYADNGGSLPRDISGRPPSRETVNDLIARLDGEPNTRRECVGGARGKSETITIYAIVDPGDEITEIREDNNSATFTVKIDCSNVAN